jgi:hypothetical protein
MRRYAEDTEVAISRSREQIGEILRRWKCEGIGWYDDFAKDRVILQFIVPRLVGDRAVAYKVQFSIGLPLEAEITKHATGARGFSDVRYADLMAKRGRREHRVLHLWIKAALEAVEDGIVPFEAIFLPFFLRDDGQTVAEAVLPQLPKLMGAPAARMLTSGGVR